MIQILQERIGDIMSLATDTTKHPDPAQELRATFAEIAATPWPAPVEQPAWEDRFRATYQSLAVNSIHLAYLYGVDPGPAADIVGEFMAGFQQQSLAWVQLRTAQIAGAR